MWGLMYRTKLIGYDSFLTLNIVFPFFIIHRNPVKLSMSWKLFLCALRCSSQWWLQSNRNNILRILFVAQEVFRYNKTGTWKSQALTEKEKNIYFFRSDCENKFIERRYFKLNKIKRKTERKRRCCPEVFVPSSTAKNTQNNMISEDI